MSKHDLYPELALAQKALNDAEAHFHRVLADTFPIGTRVRVNHHRGSFTGVVSQVEKWGGSQRVYVTNDATGKTSGRYPLLSDNGKPCIELLAREAKP